MQHHQRHLSSASDDIVPHQNRRRALSDSIPVTQSRRSRIRNPFRSSNGASARHERSTGNTDEDFNTQSDEDRTESSTQVAVVASLPTISQHSRKNSNNPPIERFVVKPVYAYPKVKMTKEELRKEMNRTSSYFHDYTKEIVSASLSSTRSQQIGAVHLEILQCFGLPRRDIRKKRAAFGVIVCDGYAFKTDVMLAVTNPMLLSKHRRACVFPLFQAYSRVYIGIFAKVDKAAVADRFIGRIVLDVSRLRPGSTYDVTLPLRLSNQVYSRAKQGAVRCRVHLQWDNERAAMLSYLPRGIPRFRPHDKITVRCSDNKAFQNVARTVHGHDLPGKFSMRLTKATAREVNFIRVHVFRYIVKREFRSITQWRYPIISLFVFVAWAHAVFTASLSYVPGHIVTVLLLYLWKSYTHYILDPSYSKGFPMPYVEELMGTLLFGKGIETLQMERKDVLRLNDLSDNDSEPQSSNLQELAKVFQDNVPRIKRRQIGPGAFFGREAVTFLVENNYASSRQGAVDLGKRLQYEMSLFHHIRNRQIDFRDSDVVFVLSNVEMSTYTFRTHNPWFSSVSHFLFPAPGNTRSDVHMEFPFASFQDHPRFTVREGLDSTEPMNLLERMQNPNSENDLDDFDSSDDESEEDDYSTSSVDEFEGNNGHMKDAIVESFSSSFADILKVNSTDSTLQQTFVVESTTPPLSPSQSMDEYDLEDDPLEIDVAKLHATNAEDGTEVLLLSKPPNQDIDFVQKKDKPISQLLYKTSVEVHSKFGHLFHDKAYKLRSEMDSGMFKTSNSARDQLVTSAPKSQLLRKTAAVLASSMPQSSYVAAEMQELARVDATVQLKARKDTLDKLLRTGKFSNNNLLLGKLGLIVHPLVEIAQTFLASFRASFNIMTWRDPFLSFWVAVFGIVMVPILHLFPWRLFLGVAGLVLVGPQNYIIRLTKEYFQGPNEDNLDVVVRKKRTEDDDKHDTAAAIFSNTVVDNRPVRQEGVAVFQDVKEVAIPQSQLLYRRCYDWPPEPEYARVTVSSAPKSNPEAEKLLEANMVETYNADSVENGTDYNLNSLINSTACKRWARLRLRTGRKKEA